MYYLNSRFPNTLFEQFYSKPMIDRNNNQSVQSNILRVHSVLDSSSEQRTTRSLMSKTGVKRPLSSAQWLAFHFLWRPWQAQALASQTRYVSLHLRVHRGEHTYLFLFLLLNLVRALRNELFSAVFLDAIVSAGSLFFFLFFFSTIKGENTCSDREHGRPCHDRRLVTLNSPFDSTRKIRRVRKKNLFASSSFFLFFFSFFFHFVLRRYYRVRSSAQLSNAHICCGLRKYSYSYYLKNSYLLCCDIIIIFYFIILYYINQVQYYYVSLRQSRRAKLLAS